MLRLFWEGLISLASAESRVDFNIAKQSHMANPKHPFLFTLKKPFSEQAKKHVLYPDSLE